MFGIRVDALPGEGEGYCVDQDVRHTFRTVDGRRLHWAIHCLPRLDASIMKNSRVALLSLIEKAERETESP